MRVEYDPEKLLAQPIEGTNLSRLMRSFPYTVQDQMNRIAKGKESDGSSVPWGFRNIVDRRKVRIAGWIHDDMYTKQKYSRKVCDQVWRIVAMRGPDGSKANRLQGWLGYMGLRVGGWYVWRKK